MLADIYFLLLRSTKYKSSAFRNINVLYTWKKEDPIRPVDYPGAICFLYSIDM